MTVHTGIDWRRRDPGHVENLGIEYSGSTFSIVSGSGSSLSGTRNTGFVSMPSASTPGVILPMRVTADETFIDDTGASTIAGQLFGFSSGNTMLSDVPFFIYACINDADSAVAFSISRTPAMDRVPVVGEIGKSGTTTATRSYSHFFLGNPTLADYAENPCMMIGSFRMQLSTAPGGWTVQPLTHVDGIGRFQERGRFELLPGVKGAAANSFFATNGGTAPIWVNQFFGYTIFPHDALCEVYAQLSGAGTPGAGAVQANMMTPFCHTNLAGSSGRGPLAKFGGDLTFIEISEDPSSENIRIFEVATTGNTLYDLEDFDTTLSLTVKALYPILQEP